ncbi:PqqD family peptide modification chaperone [Brevundimonas sp. A19_0]|uniref:PqqD family peptide modification chaperone n=1 Tax=Brevundimonas sp. A19_0 TaxID=2821087 RepID=UPI001ADD41EE|nr:PqqD family peptide modification chaperone [Brevundimonas sp. A19_0]MBO9500671.1 PqqD family protein [Brevundimonas sp. A19_0]
MSCMETTFADDQRVVASGDLITTRVDGEVMAMNVERGTCYGLDAIGSRIWDLIASPVAVGDVIGQLTTEYDVSREVCRTDVFALLTSLESEGLIRRL